MPSSNEPVKPTPFEAVPPKAPESVEAGGGTGPAPGNWVVPGLVALVLLALLVIFWLPSRVDSPAIPAPAPDPTPVQAERPPAPAAPGPAPASAAEAPAAAAAEPGASPWSDAQMARLRLEAQDVLAELLDLQFLLEERGVQHWGAAEFAAAAGLAAEGDARYREREYETASGHYREALVTLRSLEARIPEVLDGLLEELDSAIEAGDTAAATAHLEVAQMIEPDSEPVVALSARVDTLPELVTLLASAARSEAADDLASAQLTLEQATALDPGHRRAAAELNRVAGESRLRAFRRAMSDGYVALGEGRFDAARESFTDAGKLQPGSAEAASALQELATAESSGSLSRLREQGLAQERREQWQDAVATYERALGIDATVLFATEGLARAGERARLDRELSAILDEPGRLADVAVAERAAGFLREAGAIRPGGERLARQVAQLEELLRLANTPVTITLVSDMETEVIVYKVARLGRFQQQQLELRPGTYTAVGTRNGFRDVRRQFEVGHDAATGAVSVICTERI